MNLQEARQEAQKKLGFKNHSQLHEEIEALEVKKGVLSFDSHVKITTEAGYDENSDVFALAKKLMPWRKGPFAIDNISIDSEWQSDKKFDILKEHLDINGKIVGDIGCNNGYYMYKMLPFEPKKIIGFDPYPHYYLQFLFLQKFCDANITFEMLGVEHLDIYDTKFDTLLCLGVLYHRPDPLGTLRSLRNALNRDGELIIDCIIIDGDDEICLVPQKSYAKMKNVYFIPTLRTLQGWLERCGFEITAQMGVYATTTDEQRATQWSGAQSLEDFLDPCDHLKTVEGYSAPKRAYLKCRRKNG